MGSGSSMRGLARHTAVYALGPALSKLLGFLLLPLVTLWIGGAGQFGVLEMGGVTVAVLSQVLGINLLHGMTRFHADAQGERERKLVVSTTWWLLFGSTGIALCAAAAFPELASELMLGSSAHGRVALVVFAILFAQTLGQVGLRWLQAEQRSGTYVAITTAKTVLEIGLKIALLLAGYQALGALLSVLGGELVVALALTALLVWRARLAYSPALAKKLLAYSLPLVASGLFLFVLHQADRWFVQRLHGDAEVGVYAVGYKLGALSNVVLLEAFGLIWFPWIFAIADEDAARAAVRRVAGLVALVFGAATFALASFAGPFTDLMVRDPELAAAAGPLPLVAFGYLAWALHLVLQTPFYLRRRTGIVTWLAAGAAAVNLALNAALVPEHGAMGAAWATLATFVLLAAAAWIAAERVGRIGFERGRILAPVLLAAGLYLACRALGTGPSALAVKAAALIAFPVLLWCGGYLEASEKVKIRAMLGRTVRPS